MGLPSGRRDGLRVSNSRLYVSGAGRGEKSPGVGRAVLSSASIIEGVSRGQQVLVVGLARASSFPPMPTMEPSSWMGHL